MSRYKEEAKRYYYILGRHGYLTTRAPEVKIMKPCEDAFAVGSHLRWMCREIMDGSIQGPKLMRWISFIRGGLFSLGVRTLEEMVSEFRSDEHE